MSWLRRLTAGRAERAVPVAEPMEPRILYSADLAAGLALGSGLSGYAEIRTLAENGEYDGAQQQQAPAAVPVAAAYATTALNFEANEGQGGNGSDFIARGGGYGIALDDGGATLTLVGDGGSKTIRLDLAGANDSVAEGEHLLQARSNYLIGGDPSQWHTDIANYGSVVYRNVYDGIDVRYYGTQRQLEYDFVVSAGADASAISLRFSGAESATIDANGDLVLHVAGSEAEVRFKAPVSYQRGEAGLEAVASRYEIRADGSIGFVLGDYDHSRELVIDPVLDYASYFGGSNAETALDTGPSELAVRPVM